MNFTKTHILSGFLLFLDDKILLVKSKKYIDMEDEDKWSIPKGKLNNNDIISNSLIELKEETGIILKNINFNNIYMIEYIKKNILKKLFYIKVVIKKEDLNIDIFNDEIPSCYYDNNEICKAKFFSIKDAYKYIQIGQKQLIKL